MALTTKERSARAAEKRRLAGEEVLRLPVRAGTKAALLDLMEKNGIEEMAEAMTLMIHNAHKFGPAMFAVARHEISVTEVVAQRIAQLGAEMDNDEE